ncbi:hypothetical protein [Hoeflea sp.]|uniref:glycine zipper domain-containing protein n=1 Tax=Hoeflea sp. TaxID=1940281 RepID=UPI0019982D62|nr:hypothetical protein [Hoeflea sp.]MBC7284432.1 DUF883 family protein [Hoeflea sp.]
MADDSKTAKGASAASDYEAISEQLAALRADMSRLAETVGAITERRGRSMAADIAEGLGEAKHYAEARGRSAEAQLETSVAAHPWMSIGLAAVAGFLVGALSRR